MRKALLCALTTALALSSLVSCSGAPAPKERLQEIQDDLSSVQQFSLVASVRADYGEHVYDFRLNYQGDSENGTITIIEPESVAGAQLDIEDGSTSISYDGARIYTGEILPDGLSPADCLPAMLSAFREGMAFEVSSEDWEGTSCLRAAFTLSDDTELVAWFDDEAGLPIHSEISHQGYTVIYCDFFNITAQ